MNISGKIKQILFLSTLISIVVSCSSDPKQQAKTNKQVLHDTIIVYKEKPVELTVKKENEKNPILSKEEQEIRKLINEMHISWQKMIDTKDDKEILKYFAPSYITNQVSVYADNSGSIQSYTNRDFPKYLKSVIKRKGYKYEFSKVRFLDIEIKDNTYFNAVYKSRLDEISDGGEKSTNSLIITVTGKKVKSQWKIGNYSWVNFQYQ